METSDSEYFESADEDFNSEDEDPKTVKSSDNIKLENLKIREVEDKTSEECSKLDNVQKDNENNVSTVKEVKKLGAKAAKKAQLEEKPPKTNAENEGHDKSEEHTEKEKVSSELQDNEAVKEAELKEPTKRNTEGLKRKDGPETQQEKVTTKIQEQEEENLWDDSEVEWGNKEPDNMWDNDDWEPVEPPKEPKNIEEEKNTSWGAWGTWGVSSILSTSVSTITQGISNVLETGIGVPEPEELAKMNKAEKEKMKEKYPEMQQEASGFNLGNLVMGVTKLVETTGTKVISGGLDTLETIGKKTMEVLQEGDPGLKKKRAFLKIDQDKPVLSQLLREAKEKAEQENKEREQKHFSKKAKNYETLFDDHQGLVHLEALEMLSKQCDIKLQTLLESSTADNLTDIQETMDQVKELCELPDEDEEEQMSFDEVLDKVNGAVTEINIPISYKKLIETWEETESWLSTLKLEICDERELHQQAVETLAQLTALAVEQFHKTGELLLVKEHRSTADEADSLVQLTTSLTSLIGIVAAKFSDKLNAKSSNSNNKEEINALITNVFFEAANSSSYIQDAFQLLVPVLQVGAV